MRNKFSELVAAGVAEFKYKPTTPGTPDTCPICRMYNNIWGIITDTHASIVDGRPVITGTLVGDPKKWSQLQWASNWGGVTFEGSGWCSLSEFFRANMVQPNGIHINGQVAIELIPCEDCTCADCACVAYHTSESLLPQPIKVLGDIYECLNRGSLDEIAKAMNHSNKVVGEHWHVAEGTIAGRVGQQMIILELNYDKGIKIESPELATLLDNEGIPELFLRQFPRYFVVDSDDKKWQVLLRRDENNRTFVKSFDELTPQEWFEEIKAIIAVYA